MKRGKAGRDDSRKIHHLVARRVTDCQAYTATAPCRTFRTKRQRSVCAGAALSLHDLSLSLRMQPTEQGELFRFVIC